MTLELYTELKLDIEKRLDAANLLVTSFPTNEMGLAIRTKDFLSAKRNFDIVFNQLRVLNSKAGNSIKRELAMKRRFNKIK